MITFLDIETTGLPPSGAHYKEDFECFPRIVQLAWCVDQGEINSHIIKPDGWEISFEAASIHKISHGEALIKGKPLKDVLNNFIIDCDNSDTLVAHNIYFDVSIIKSELYRMNIDETLIERSLHKEKRIDTLRKTIKFVNAEFEDGRKGKWPRLNELYFKLFNKPMDILHSADGDVKALRECYYELVKIGIL